MTIQRPFRALVPALALMLFVLLSPPLSTSGSSIGFATAARREVEVDVSGDVDDEYDEYEDEYDDEDYEEEEYEETFHEPVNVNTREEYEKWENSEMSTALWAIIDRGDTDALAKALESDPNIVYIRSVDGRGPLFWAYEYERYEMVKLLLDKGADASAVDARGNTPVGLVGKDERPSQDGGDLDDEDSGEDEYEDEYEDEDEDGDFED